MLQDASKIFHKAATFLLNTPIGTGTLSTDLCRGLLEVLKSKGALDQTDLRLSIDLFTQNPNEWWIEVSTDPEAPLGVRYKSGLGFTGHLLKTKRESLRIDTKHDLPLDLKCLKGYHDTQSAYLHAIRINGVPVGCFCIASDSPQAVSRKCRNIIARLAQLMSVLLSTKGALTLRVPKVKAIDSILSNSSAEWWFSIHLPAHYRFVDFWSWRSLSQDLVVSAVSDDLKTSNNDWLHPLKLGEGFAGAAAERLEMVWENDIQNGVGMHTGISTPHREIRPGTDIRALLAIPVRTRDRLIGVLIVMGDSPDYFSQQDIDILQQLCEQCASHEQERLHRYTAKVQNKISEKLHNSLQRNPTPSEFWPMLTDAMGLFIKHQFVYSVAFLVRRRRNPSTFSCKVLLPTAKDDELILSISRDSMLSNLLQFREPWRWVDHIKLTPSNSTWISPYASRLYVQRYSLSSDGDCSPSFLVVLGTSEDTPYSQSADSESATAFFRSTIGLAFTVTRAVLNARDVETLREKQKWLLATYTHDLRAPLGAIRHAAEAMKPEIENDIKRRDTILNRIEDSILTLENMLYRSWFSDLSTETGGAPADSVEPSHIDMLTVVREILEDIRCRYPDETILLSIKSEDDKMKCLIFGYERWIVVAIRNVVENAVKFGQSQPIQLRMSIHEDFIRLEVQDRGIGIPSNELKKIFIAGFQSLYRRRHNVTGSQTALSVSKAILEKQGGKIWAQSQVNKGATFFIELPLQGG